jgi:hypothetical protein
VDSESNKAHCVKEGLISDLAFQPNYITTNKIAKFPRNSKLVDYTFSMKLRAKDPILKTEESASSWKVMGSLHCDSQISPDPFIDNNYSNTISMSNI